MCLKTASEKRRSIFLVLWLLFILYVILLLSYQYCERNTSQLCNIIASHDTFHFLTHKFKWKARITRKLFQNFSWINPDEGREFSDYGDGSCPDNEDRNILNELFAKWVEISKANNVSYFISTGTLLGAWRNGDLIPYDTDLDVMINSNDNEKLEKIKDKRDFSDTYDKFRLILQEDWRLPYAKRRRFKCNGKLVESYSDHCSFQEPLGRVIKNNRHLDIYDYKIVDDTIYDPSEWKKSYPVSDILPYRYCKFMKFTTFCPKKPLTILKAFYENELAPSKICKQGEWVEKG